jgi:hypothetical protein
MLSNNAFERPMTRHTPARVRRVSHSAPSARLKARRSAAQRERSALSSLSIKPIVPQRTRAHMSYSFIGRDRSLRKAFA